MYETSNETISSKTPSKINVLKKVSGNKCFKVQDAENQIEFKRSVETFFTPITKAILKTTYAFKPQTPNLESTNSSKMPVAIFDEREFIAKYDKYRKQLKETKKHEKYTAVSCRN